MKISFHFDSQSRSFQMIPEDILESTLLTHLADLSKNGARFEIKSIETGTPEEEFRVEMKINGKSN